MNFTDAVSTIAAEDSARFGNPFYLYSRLCDLIGESEEDRKKCRLFYEIDKIGHVLKRLSSSGRRAYRNIIKSHSDFGALVGEDKFVELIDTVANAVDPKILEKEEAQKNAKRIAIAVGIAAPLVIAGILCLILFRGYITWSGWQHVIGAVGGFILVGLLLIIGPRLERGCMLNAAISGVIAIANTVLLYVFKQSYSTIFIWLSAHLIIECVLYIIIDLAISHTDAVKAHIAATAFTVLSLIVGIVFVAHGYFLPWSTWQYIIGALGGLTVFLITVTVMLILHSEDADTAAGTVGSVVGAIFVVANTVLYYVFKQNYNIVFYWITAYLLVGGIALFFGGFDEDDDIFVVQIVINVFAILSLIIAIVFNAHGYHLDWNAWQYVIGALGGAAVFAIVASIAGALYSDSDKTKAGVLVAIVTGALLIASNVLFYVFKQNFNTIFYWIIAFVLVGGIVMTIINFEEGEDDCGGAQLIIFILTLLSLIIGMVYNCNGYNPAWNVWQHLIGALGGGVIFAIAAGVAVQHIDASEEETAGVFASIATGVLLIASNVLFYIFKQNFSTIFYWIIAFVLVGGIIMAIVDFNETEEDCGIAQIIITVLTVLSLIIAIVFHAHGYRLDWNARQHVLGSIGGLAAVLILSFAMLDSSPFPVTLALIANTVLFYIFGPSYYIIYYWVTAYLVVFGVMLSAVHFDDGDDGFGIAHVVITAITVASLIVSIVYNCLGFTFVPAA